MEFLQVEVKLGHGILYLLRAAASVLLDLISRDTYWCDCQHLLREGRHSDKVRKIQMCMYKETSLLQGSTLSLRKREYEGFLKSKKY